jgi:colanic acid/amylovoran biosynthesis protein
MDELKIHRTPKYRVGAAAADSHTVLLRGGFHRNRGDEMMALAVREQVSNAWPRAIFARETRSGSYEDRSYFGYHQLIRAVPARTLRGFLADIFLKRYRTTFGLVAPDEITAIFDVSGYYYADIWDQSGLRRSVEAFQYWRGRGLPVIIMPQSFGPFRRPDTIACMRDIADCADLIYARDKSSRALLDECIGPRSNARTAPDFTNLLKPLPADPSKFPRPYGCVIPNFRIVERGTATIQNYSRFLTGTLQELSNNELEPIILLHSPEQDGDLARWVQTQVRCPVRIVASRDPRHLKGILGAAHLVVGSRFHGLVSSLSQGVPSIGLGWTHKFRDLFESYECSELLLADCSDDELLRSAIRICNEAPSRQELISRIGKACQRAASETMAMWTEITNVLDSGP